MRRFLFCWSITVALTACVSSPPTPVVPEDPAAAKLQAVAEEVAHVLAQLAELQQAAIPKPTTYAIPSSGPLTVPVTLTWEGPPEPLLSLLADLIGYDFRALGKPPLTADSVTLEVRRRPAWTVLEDIGWQLGTRATVVVNEPIREIQLIYAGQQP